MWILKRELKLKTRHKNSRSARAFARARAHDARTHNNMNLSARATFLNDSYFYGKCVENVILYNTPCIHGDYTYIYSELSRRESDNVPARFTNFANAFNVTYISVRSICFWQKDASDRYCLLLLCKIYFYIFCYTIIYMCLTIKCSP